ncbi:filamentous hemagglutinin N-terminal domain-containing protein [Nostoc sp. KVJ3]|uniref:two-partner secretion domain-containing protein n=1 Tax=Nostoc sp. KVJ3 TaxID=457945 RepID=UPI00223894AE|nr:filamentous hemagglutinin N-terminal domain-containing protein [Nostoc sp. KVJ3]MCW5312856.1 filamentous hemagglutinin N-terminal domain-containing protein [Nostoc sp. KVJ3]
MKITEEWSILQALYRFWSVLSIQSESIVRRDLGDRRINRFKFWQILIPLATTSGVIVSGHSTIAQIVPDRTLGKESSIVTPNVDIKGVQSDRIDGGAIRGSALFHSFQEFSIGEGRGGYFSNPSGIENIFSRVTGTNASNIYGKLGVLGNANLFLLNPNGIIFGPNASLDLNGSFLGSTGNSFNFGNGKEFSASNPTAPPLLSVSVPLGVQFNQKQPSAIANLGNLSTKQNLTLLGGTVASTGQLSASEGQIAVAAVPSGSVVNLSSTGQFQNIDTSSALGAGNSASLTKLLTSIDERSRLGLTVNNNGQVELSGSGLPVVDGDVVAKNITAQTATLTAHHNLTLVESQIGTNGDLNLLAGDTVRIRDSEANPFVAQAGGNLLVQGRQGVDIFALNNSSSGLVSGRDMVLRSANTVGGDAHYWAGGNFRIEQLDGSLGGLFSPYDPIIRAAGDVSFDSYTGGSLHILAGGSVKINGNVEITGADANALIQTVPLSDTTTVEINGTISPTLDIRAGVRADAIAGTPIEGSLIPVSQLTGIPNRNEITNFNRSDNEPTSANIEIGSIVNTRVNGQIFLTNQYQPNNLSTGSIQITNGITDPIALGLGSFSIRAYGNPVTIDARGDVKVAGIITGTGNGRGGDINIISEGGIDTRGGKILSRSSEIAGNVTLQAIGDIHSGNIEASNTSNTGNPENFSDITLESSQGSVFLDKVQLEASNNGSDFAGDINIFAPQGNVEITGTGSRNSGQETILTNGYFGRINIEAGGQVSITDSTVSAQTLQNLPAPAPNITRRAGDISITSQQGNIDISNSVVDSSTNVINVGNIDAGNINIDATNGSVSVTKASQVLSSNAGRGEGNAGSVKITARDTVTIAGRSINGFATVGSDVIGDGIGDGGLLTIQASSVDIKDGAIVAASILNGKGRDRNGGFAQAGSVNIIATNKVAVNNSVVFSEIGSGSVGNGGKVNITAPTIIVDNGASLITNVRKADRGRSAGRGSGGDIILSTDSFSLKNGSLLATSVSGQSPSPNIRGSAGNIIIKGYNTEASKSISIDGQGINDFSNLFGSLNPNNDVNLIVPSAILSTVEASAEGTNNGGKIDITTDSLSVTNFARLITSTFAQGKAGNLIIKASDQVTFDGGFAFATVETPTERAITGQGGDINIKTGSLFVRNGAQMQALTRGRGNAGKIIINASDSVNISGSSSALFTSAEPGSIGSGGDITIGSEIRPNLFRISDGAALIASTNNAQQAGSITINANRVEAINGGKLIAETTSNGGAAGTITINAGRRVNVNGNSGVETGLFVRSQRSASTAGDIKVNAPIVFLDNNGKLIAESGGGNGGNITLEEGTLLLLRHNSLISTTAGKEGQPGNGGKININYPQGFVIAGFRRNNDIAADAFKDFGGKVTITALGAVNIDTLSFLDLKRQFPPGTTAANLNPQLLPTNDATANSLTNPNGGGIVEINAPNIDPTRGTIQLPEDLGDSSKLIAQSCRVGVQGAANSFIVTGRGGLPSSPNSALSTDTFLGSAANTSGEQTTSIPLPLREAQGVEIGSGGEIILTAHPSTLTSHTPWQRLNSCNGQ